MKTLTRILVMFTVLAVAGLGIFLATWDMPAPTSTYEENIPNARFKK